MRIYKYLFFLVTLAFAGCINEETVPANIIQIDRMASLCAEIHQVDGSLMNGNQMPDSIYQRGMGTFILVFKKYQTDTAAFKKSYMWYTQHPKKLDEVYTNVQAILQKRVDSLTKLPSGPPPKPGNNTTPVQVPAQSNSPAKATGGAPFKKATN